MKLRVYLTLQSVVVTFGTAYRAIKGMRFSHVVYLCVCRILRTNSHYFPERRYLFGRNSLMEVKCVCVR